CAIVCGVAVVGAETFLFTSFRRNGETGVYFALSDDGRKWEQLGAKAWVTPQRDGMLMRDPFLTRGPDGTYHMIWTWGWTRKEGGGSLKIGYSSSRDLVTWTQQREIPVFGNEPGARNVWAPEAAWDPNKREWIIFWATTIPGRFADTEGTGDSGYNHRLYSMTTRDWQSFSEPRLWFDPGFNSIDSTVVQDGSRWIMIFKDERRNPVQKRLRLAFADSPAGRWKDISEPFTIDWVEGPSAIRMGKEWWIYFDHYTKPHYYGAVRTTDWKTFEDVSKQVSFPDDHRHGTVIRISDAEARRLRQAATAR
ncbi:MAG TPA: glycoside hydrolase family 43 protein, partial [Bryobacteraceae bacterium]|nr:glycoside hydrolase family 43 protein [Bryobacteraceae bacterium]